MKTVARKAIFITSIDSAIQFVRAYERSVAHLADDLGDRVFLVVIGWNSLDTIVLFFVGIFMVEQDDIAGQLMAFHPSREEVVEAVRDENAAVQPDDFILDRLSGFTYFTGPAKHSGFVAFSQELSLAIGQASSRQDALRNCLLSTYRELLIRWRRGEPIPDSGEINPRLALVRSTMLRGR